MVYEVNIFSQICFNMITVWVMQEAPDGLQYVGRSGSVYIVRSSLVYVVRSSWFMWEGKGGL